jgi:hypothetical protein
VQAERALEEFLRDAPTHLALDLRDALMSRVESHEYLIVATADDDTPTLLAFDGDELSFYRRHDEAITIAMHKSIGAMSLTEHWRLVDGGLLEDGYTLKHPLLPRTGELKVKRTLLIGDEGDEFLRRVKPFLAPRPIS